VFSSLPAHERPGVVHLMSGDQWAGAEVMALGLLAQLRKEGEYEPSAICLNEGTLSQRLRDSGVDVCVLPERTLSFGAIVRAGRAWLSSRFVRVLHSHRYKEHLLGALLAPQLGARLVATVHGLPEPARGRRLRYSVQQRAAFWLLRHRFDIVVAVSEALRRDLIDLYAMSSTQVRSVRNGIVVPNFRFAARGTGCLHIGSVGRLVPVKGFELFVDVARLLRKRHQDVRFSILGEGPERAALTYQATTAGLVDVFSFAAPNPEPWPYYESLDLYLNTSVTEGLPLSILEAMSAGLPVVAPAVGGIPDVIRHGDTGYLVESRDAGHYSAVCSALLHDPGDRARIGSAARMRVLQEFSATRMAKDYVSVYDTVCGARRAETTAS